MPEDSQTQPNSSEVTAPVEQAVPAVETPMPTAMEPVAPTEPVQVPSEPFDSAKDKPVATAPATAPHVLAQTVGNEPLDTTHDKPLAVQSAPVFAEPSVPRQEPQIAPAVPAASLPISVSTQSITEPPSQHLVSRVEASPKSFLAKALEVIQFRKKAKLEKIMKLAREKHSITNDQVQKLLRISDATASRYLSELVRQGRLRQLGIRGSARYEPTVGSYGGN